VDWLAHPGNSSWIRFEAREYGSLDDFAICSSDHELTLVQVKHTGERPNRPGFDLDDLVERDATHRSLFQKWFFSWVKARGLNLFQSITPVLKTNKPAAPDLTSVSQTVDGARIIDPSLLKSSGPTIYAEFVKQAGNQAELLDLFLSVLRLELDLPDIPALRDLLLQRGNALNIGATDCLRLEDEVWKWAIRSSQLTLQDVKRACGWFQPVGFNEDFPIPADYVPLGHDLVKTLTEQVNKPVGGLRILVGSPGSGKSTLLSELYKEIIKKKGRCVRHHYFVPESPLDAERRLRAKDAATGLLFEMLQNVPEMSATINPTPDQLSTIIQQVADKLASDGSSLTIIIDGLDHVTREESEGELIEFLRNIFPARQGLWVVLGSRYFTASSRIQTFLEKYALPSDWIDIPRMSRDECEKFLSFHRQDLRLENGSHFEEILAAFYTVTEGHPLHARYTLTRMKQLARTGFILADEIRAIEPFGGDIAKLYRQVWASMGRAAQHLAILLAVAHFPVAEEHAAAILADVGHQKLLEGIEALKPLTNLNATRLQFFHPSFADFVQASSQYRQLEMLIRQNLIRWLESAAPEDIRWAWLLRHKYEAGDDEPLIAQTTRAWVIQSVSDCRDSAAILEILQLALSAATARGDFDTALRRGQLTQYFENSYRWSDNKWDELEAVNRRRVHGTTLTEDVEEDIRFREPNFLVAIARDADSRGSRDLIQRATEELNRRLASGAHSSPSEPLSILTALMRVAALQRTTVVPRRAARFIAGLQTEHKRAAISAFVEELIATGQSIAFGQFCGDAHLTPEDVQEALALGARAALLHHFDVGDIPVANSPWAALYGSLIRSQGFSVGSFPTASAIPVQAKEYESEETAVIADLFEAVFGWGVVAGAGKQSLAHLNWAGSLSSAWSHTAARLLAEFGNRVGSAIRRTAPIQPSEFSLIEKIDKLEFNENREIWGLYVAFRRAFRRALLTSLTLQYCFGNHLVNGDQIAVLKRSKHLTVEELVELLADLPPGSLSVPDVTGLLAEQHVRWQLLIEEFPTRADALLNCAKLAHAINSPQLSLQFARSAASNLLGYGNHKDLFLLEVLECLDACQPHTTPVVTRDWLAKSGPIVNQIAAFTDRDETGTLLVDYSRRLLAFDRNAAFSLFIDLCREERLYLAEDVFVELIRQLRLDDPLELAIARTALDEDSRRELLSISTAGSAPAKQISDELISLYGPLQEDRGESSAPASPPYEIPTRSEPLPVEQVAPSEIAEVLESLHYGTDREHFFSSWLELWMNASPEEAHGAIKNWFELKRTSLFESKLLLLFYPYARQLGGPQEGFEILVAAHRAAYGWNRFWSDSKSRKQIFDLISRDYPDRWVEFIHETLRGPRHRYGILPVPVGAQFLLRFNAVDQAVALCQASVDVLQELMADLQLPEVRWLENPASPLDVLSARLFWITSPIRERSAIVFADLMSESTCAEETYAYLLQKIAQETLDSRVVTWLMPVLRAARKGFALDLGRLEAALPMRSRPINAVYEEIRIARSTA